MPRKARKNLNTPFLHVIVQGVNKEYIFYKEGYIKEYLKIIAKVKKDYTFEMLAYCIMNNHAHFLVYVENIDEFGKFMQRVNLNYAQMYNNKEKRCGVLFRNRYQAEPIYDIRYLINCIKYIHENPVKANMVKKCEDYKYSSYNDYINNIGISQSKIIKKYFGYDCNYLEIFKSTCEMRYMDMIDEISVDADEYIQAGISEFNIKYDIDTFCILSDRNVFKELIKFLKEDCKIKYVEIMNFFGISRGIMEDLKLK